MQKTLYISLISLVCLYASSYGQEYSEAYHAYKTKYPENQAVFDKYYEDMDIALVADSVCVRSRHYKEMVHLGDQSSIFAKDKIYSSLFYKVSDIQASTRVPYKKKYKTIKVTDFRESFDKNSQVFYDDTKVVSFMYPAIVPGAHTVLEYSETITDPRFLGSFMFGNYLPIAHCKYTITVDAGIEIDFKLMNDPEHQVKVSKQSLGKRTQYVYEVFNSENIQSESDAPNVKYYAPHLNLIVRSYKNAKGNTVNVLSSPADLYAWYRTFVQNLQQAPDEGLKALVDKLTADAGSEEEKVKRIFYWVQENIKYIAFEDGMRGLIPHKAAYIYEKRFGDCKDMATLLVNMMHQAGIQRPLYLDRHPRHSLWLFYDALAAGRQPYDRYLYQPGQSLFSGCYFPIFSL